MYIDIYSLAQHLYRIYKLNHVFIIHEADFNSKGKRECLAILKRGTACTLGKFRPVFEHIQSSPYHIGLSPSFNAKIRTI